MHTWRLPKREARLEDWFDIIGCPSESEREREKSDAWPNHHKGTSELNGAEYFLSGLTQKKKSIEVCVLYFFHWVWLGVIEWRSGWKSGESQVEREERKPPLSFEYWAIFFLYSSMFSSTGKCFVKLIWGRFHPHEKPDAVFHPKHYKAWH